MTSEIVASLRAIWGGPSIHEDVFVALLEGLKPADDELSVRVARRLVDLARARERSAARDRAAALARIPKHALRDMMFLVADPAGAPLRTLPPIEGTVVEQVLFWFALGPVPLLEARFRFYADDGEALLLDAREGINACLTSQFTVPTTGQIVEGAELAERLFPYFVLREPFLRALAEKAGA